MRGASPVLSSTSRGAWFIVLSRRLDDEARLGEDRRVVRPARSHHHGSQEVEPTFPIYHPNSWKSYHFPTAKELYPLCSHPMA